QYRRHAFVLILVISAVLTPTGDPVNLMIMAVPMYILFELGLLATKLFLKQDTPQILQTSPNVSSSTSEHPPPSPDIPSLQAPEVPPLHRSMPDTPHSQTETTDTSALESTDPPASDEKKEA
ncbi:MAG: twin-arginine translocase subunit TatC, partial [Myxococcota bacterium]